MSGTTWAKWFWSDWLSDPSLRLCSYAARGLWIDMLAIAATSGGYVEINGRPLNNTEIARTTSGSVAEVDALVAELENNNVFSRDRRGCIYSRRIVRDAKRHAKGVENGKKGGNPKLSKQKEKPSTLNSHIPDTRIQSPETKKEEPALALTGGASSPSDGWPSDAWETFYEKYPHKVGKGAARKAFDKVRRSGIPWDRFWGGLLRYANKTDDRPWCNPATWLNQQRWDDEPARQVSIRGSPASPGKITPSDLARSGLQAFGNGDRR